MLHICIQKMKYYVCGIDFSQKNLQGKSSWFSILFDGWISILFLNPKLKMYNKLLIVRHSLC